MLHHVRILHLLPGYHRVVCRKDAVARHDSSLLRRASAHGLDYVDGVLQHIESDAYAAELPLQRRCELLCLRRCRVRRMRVEGLQHRADSLRRQFLTVDVLNIEILDDALRGAEFLRGGELHALGHAKSRGRQQHEAAYGKFLHCNLSVNQVNAATRAGNLREGRAKRPPRSPQARAPRSTTARSAREDYIIKPFRAPKVCG